MEKIKVRRIAGRQGSEHLGGEFEIDAGHPEITSISDTQRRVNELMGIKDEDFLAAICKGDFPPDIVSRDAVRRIRDGESQISEGQKKINQMMGIDDATFKKYNP